MSPVCFLLMCVLALAQAQFYLPTSNAQKYVRPRVNEVKPGNKRDANVATGQQTAGILLGKQKGNVKPANSRSTEGANSNKEKWNLVCSLALQIVNEEIERVQAEIGSAKGGEVDSKIVKERTDEALNSINQYLPLLDYCYKYYGSW